MGELARRREFKLRLDYCAEFATLELRVQCAMMANVDTEWFYCFFDVNLSDVPTQSNT